MGCADVVPGVSGGTVALILGIYVRLVTAISRVDRSLLDHCRYRRWSAAAEYVDLRFLLALLGGIMGGVVAMSLVINRLLTDPATRSLTMAVFFGMILASAVMVARLIKTETRQQSVGAFLIGIVATAVAYWVSSLEQNSTGDPSLSWLFACGAVAICAMILPGISGAMILLVLGVYVHLTEIPKHLLAGEQVGRCLAALFVFGGGCALGLVLFSKVLRWLLTNYHVATMATLCGLMIGALGKLWPFQVDLTPGVEKFKQKSFELVWPREFNGQTFAVVALVLAAMTVVFVADKTSKKSVSVQPIDNNHTAN